MYTQLTTTGFIDYFDSSSNYKDKYSREALIALFDYLTDLEQETDKAIEFDGVVIACEWTEYDTKEDAVIAYNHSCNTIEDVRDEYITIDLPSGGILVQE